MHYEYRSDQGYLVAGASDAYSLVLISIYKSKTIEAEYFNQMLWQLSGTRNYFTLNKRTFSKKAARYLS